MKKVLISALFSFLCLAQSAFADRAFFKNGLNCDIIGSNIGGISHIRFIHPIDVFSNFTVMDISYEDGGYQIFKALQGGIVNRTNTPFSEVSVFENNNGFRSLVNVFSYAVQSDYDIDNPKQRGGYTGMKAKLLIPNQQDKLNILCEPFFN